MTRTLEGTHRSRDSIGFLETSLESLESYFDDNDPIQDVPYALCVFYFLEPVTCETSLYQYPPFSTSTVYSSMVAKS